MINGYHEQGIYNENQHLVVNPLPLIPPPFSPPFPQNHIANMNGQNQINGFQNGVNYQQSANY